MIIYLDFDGTVVEHAFPKIGREVPHAMRVIKRLSEAGHDIVLNTMRVECGEGNTYLKKAMDYINKHYKIEVEVKHWTPGKIHPVWEPDNKVAIFIDDIATDIPLIPAVFDGDNMVDWLRVEQILMENKIL